MSATSRYIRRVGRPRNEWANMVNKECFKMDARFANLIDDEMAWKEQCLLIHHGPAHNIWYGILDTRSLNCGVGRDGAALTY